MPVYEGPSIDEAISKGLHALGLKKEAVDIEILSDAKKGFLGMVVSRLNQLLLKKISLLPKRLKNQ